MNLTKLILTLTAVLLLIGCSGEKLPELKPPYILDNLVNYPFEPGNLLELDLQTEGLSASTETKVIRPGDLSAVVGESSEIYLKHQFIGMVSREFYLDNDTFYVEVAQFAGAENSYGYHSRFRPDGATLSKIGAESYTVGNSLYIFKDEFAAIISATEINDNTVAVITDIAKALDANIEVGGTLPVYYMIFPFKYKIDPSNQYDPYQYLDIPGFDKVFSTSYQTGEPKFRLFLTMDADTVKYKYMKKYADSLGKSVEVKKFPYDAGFSMAFKHPSGEFIMAGRVRDKLVGVIGYKNEIDEKFIRGWIKGLQ